MSKKTTKKPRRGESGDAATERCARCAVKAVKMQARLCEVYWSHTVQCPDCGVSETISELQLIRKPVKIAFQTVNGKPSFVWRCLQCGGGPVVVDGMPARLVKLIQSMDTLF